MCFLFERMFSLAKSISCGWLQIKAVIILSVIAATLIIIFYVLIYRESRRHQFAIQAQLNVAFQESQKIAFKAAKTTFLITCTVGISYFMNGVANAVSGWFFLNNKETNSTQFFAFRLQPEFDIGLGRDWLAIFFLVSSRTGSGPWHACDSSILCKVWQILYGT